jgi:DNA-binding FadR family transcriptional regulator
MNEMTSPARRAQRAPLYRQAQDAIRQLIVDRGLRPGDPLPPEAELAADFGMSRLSLREGIRSLESMGIVATRHGEGVFVAPFSFTPLVENLPYGQYVGGGDLRHLLEVREALEEAMLERVITLIDDADLTKLERLARAMGGAASRAEVARLDQDFHVRLVTPLQNPFVTDLITVFWIMFQRLRDSLPSERGAPSSLVERHLAIVVALRDGNPARARHAMLDHFAPLRQQLTDLTAEPGARREEPPR